MKNKRELNLIPNCSKLNVARKDFNIRNRKCLFVEGNDNSNDSKVYKSVKKEDVTIYPSGCKEEILDAFNQTYENQVAIVDKDYDIPNDSLKNVFYTDYNDIECTAINISNESDIMYDSLNIKTPSKEVFERKIYLKALEITGNISNLNEYIHQYNNTNNTKYSFLINLYCNNNYDIRSIRNIDFLSNNWNIKFDAIADKYLVKIDFDTEKLKKIMIKDNNNSFRGHDFFIILAYLIDNYKVIFENNNFKFDTNKFLKHPGTYLEEKYIDTFSKSKGIKKSELYQKIIDTDKGIFEK